MSMMRCCFCELDQDTDFDTGMTITINYKTETGKSLGQDTFHFCGECKDPEELSQLLTDLNIDHTIE